ncbi:MAG: thiamine-phosphate kinase [Candidatus Bathyarchaeota archaeon]|jgi:thiamine-monophosphate kinase|nr:thiamine-phosphate kinase [Candidatus Bathyarchaeota archaeon A05DMB-3]MDH7607241.1 thiamine-phosphate kinase [Candidatus Bathyarchaeota archaeon]
MKARENLGERRIIEIIQSRLDLLPKMPIPFGDDISAYNIGNGKLAILKTDMLVGKTDVPPSMSLWQAARKAVVMNVSDFAAKGVKPLAILVSLGLPRKLTEKDVEEIGRGLNSGAREYGAYIVGGDTNEASDLVISLSVFGVAEKGSLMLRSGAEPGDWVAVTGLFGKTSAGLKILLEGFKAPKDICDFLVEAVYMPKARLKEGLALAASKAVTSAIDSSDGLAWSLYEISKASSVGFLIDSVPVAAEAAKFAEMNGLDPFELAFYGGEEYELVLTVKPRLWSRAEKAVKDVGGSLIRIGRVTAEKRVLLETEGEKRVIEPRGWEHFRRH